ncbi:MAG: outer membrane protein assembly factor BamE [Gammaproteobacteria bacterium]
MLKKLFFLITVILIASSCAKRSDGSWKPPLVYRVDIQQGNVVDQSMLNKLKPGMEKEKVRFIMGTPLLQDPFHSNRWDYIYSFEPGGGEREQRHIIVHFKDDKLSHITGDVQVTHAPLDTEANRRERTVVVPLEEQKDGFFSKFWKKTKRDDGKTPEAEEVEETAVVEEPLETEPDQTIDDLPDTSVAIDTEIEDADSGRLKPEEFEDDAEEISDSQTTANTPKPEKKGLVRRFWDRMTSGGEESGDTEVETERDRRDAEMLEKAGESL